MYRAARHRQPTTAKALGQRVVMVVLTPRRPNRYCVRISLGRRVACRSRPGPEPRCDSEPGFGSRLARTSRTSSLARLVQPASSESRRASGTALLGALRDVEKTWLPPRFYEKPNAPKGDFLLTPTICCLPAPWLSVPWMGRRSGLRTLNRRA